MTRRYTILVDVEKDSDIDSCEALEELLSELLGVSGGNIVSVLSFMSEQDSKS